MLQALRDALPDLRAVEMEGAAVAQVAEQEESLAGAAGDLLRRRGGAQSFNDFVKATSNGPGA